MYHMYYSIAILAHALSLTMSLVAFLVADIPYLFVYRPPSRKQTRQFRFCLIYRVGMNSSQTLEDIARSMDGLGWFVYFEDAIATNGDPPPTYG